MSAYEKLRNKNIEDNKRILAELGLSNFLPKLSKVTLQKKKLPEKATTEKQKPKQKRKLEISDEELGSIRKRRRRSARIQGKEADVLALEDEESSNDEDAVKPSPKVFRPHSYGAIEGVEVGTTWMMRIDCSKDGIHRPTVAGIHGGPEGAYSIALSGGYDDNIDLGEGFTYTGEGGRDLKGTKANPKNLRTAPQSKDQTLTRGNLALSKNVETKQPVRVIRGYKLTSPFAPEEGYRYDGLYSVEKCWFTTGLSGFGVWKFALKRCPNQAPPPWTVSESKSSGDSTDEEKSTETYESEIKGNETRDFKESKELESNSDSLKDITCSSADEQDKKSRETDENEIKENGTRDPTKSKELDKSPDSLKDTACSSTNEPNTAASSKILQENAETTNGGSEEEEEMETTDKINGSPKKQLDDKSIEDKNASDIIGGTKKVENGTSDKNPIANKENEKKENDKPDENLKTGKQELDSKALKCKLTESDSNMSLESCAKVGPTEATVDNLTMEDNPER
ncbi:uncharacterized protein LOC134273810 [Saccostrea cucullata]|uniref:uncharacterized protein LOC134273810 n=1 Tax=Saccostrea cuccullata TaxID=36930 RepID=UPI002ED36AA2